MLVRIVLDIVELEVGQVKDLRDEAGHVRGVGQVRQESVVQQHRVRGTGGHSLDTGHHSVTFVGQVKILP
jgi:hypothetical protein